MMKRMFGRRLKVFPPANLRLFFAAARTAPSASMPPRLSGPYFYLGHPRAACAVLVLNFNGPP
jgi:hypothetical protein